MYTWIWWLKLRRDKRPLTDDKKALGLTLTFVNIINSKKKEQHRNTMFYFEKFYPWKTRLTSAAFFNIPSCNLGAKIWAKSNNVQESSLQLSYILLVYPLSLHFILFKAWGDMEKLLAFCYIILCHTIVKTQKVSTSLPLYCA